MPKIKKELDKIEEKKEKVLKGKNATKSKSSSSKKVNNEKSKSVKNSNKKSTSKKENKTSEIIAKAKKIALTDVNELDFKTKKVNLNSKTKKSKTTKKPNAKKDVAQKEEKQTYLKEYYDLPYRYNETVVKILAQTPKRLFVYWEVSDKDRETYINAFGEDFFEKTYPVLLVHNEEMNYTFEVPINDFANSWYLDIQDPKMKYVVQLGRKFRNVQDVKPEREVIQKEHINLQNDFVYITDSNELEAPNDHILFEKLGNQVTYRNVKNGNEFSKDISDIIEKLGKSYKDVNIEDIYRELYGDEISKDILSNPSSGALSSSGFRVK